MERVDRLPAELTTAVGEAVGAVNGIIRVGPYKNAAWPDGIDRPIQISLLISAAADVAHNQFASGVRKGYAANTFGMLAEPPAPGQWPLVGPKLLECLQLHLGCIPLAQVKNIHIRQCCRDSRRPLRPRTRQVPAYYAMDWIRHLPAWNLAPSCKIRVRKQLTTFILTSTARYDIERGVVVVEDREYEDRQEIMHQEGYVRDFLLAAQGQDVLSIKWHA